MGNSDNDNDKISDGIENVDNIEVNIDSTESKVDAEEAKADAVEVKADAAEAKADSDDAKVDSIEDNVDVVEEINTDDNSESTPESTDTDVSANQDDIIFLEDIEEDDPDSEESEKVTDEPKAKKKKSVSDYIRYAVMAISVCVFIYAVGSLINIYFHYKHDRDIYESLDALAVEDNSNASELPTDSNGNIDTSKIVLPQTVDYSKLKDINEDYVGWIQIPSVSISYPMVMGDDNSYYLSHSYNNEFSWSGAVFLDYRSNTEFQDDNTLIYGHHMKDGSMFCGLLKYLDEDFYKSSSNYIYIYMKDKTYIYQIFCVAEQIAGESNSFKRQFNDHFTFSDYIDSILDTNLYSTGVTCTDEDKVITLITCKVDSEDPTRVMVHGKLVASIDN